MLNRRSILQTAGAGLLGGLAGCLSRLPVSGGSGGEVTLPDAALANPGLSDTVNATSGWTVSERGAWTIYYDVAGFRKHRSHVADWAQREGRVGGFFVESDETFVDSVDHTHRTTYNTGFEGNGLLAGITGFAEGKVDAPALRSASALEDAGESYRGYDLYLDGGSGVVGVRSDAVAVGDINDYYHPGFERPSADQQERFALGMVRHAIDHAERRPSPADWVQTALDRCGTFHRADIALSTGEAADYTDNVSISATEVLGEQSRVLLCTGYPSASALAAGFDREIATRHLRLRAGGEVEVDVGDTTAFLSATVPTAEMRFAPDG